MIYSTHLLRHLRFTIGQNIRKERLACELPLQKLSAISNIPENTLHHYELGKGEISIAELLKIACVFQLDISELMA
jgi:transcriptional regulator with XRE-family HTH domain